MPRRDGGARRKKAEVWLKQAHHAVASPEALLSPIITLSYQGDLESTPSKRIYKLDQQMAKQHVEYFPQYIGHWRGFSVAVSMNDEMVVREAIARLERKHS